MPICAHTPLARSQDSNTDLTNYHCINLGTLTLFHYTITDYSNYKKAVTSTVTKFSKQLHPEAGMLNRLS